MAEPMADALLREIQHYTIKWHDQRSAQLLRFCVNEIERLRARVQYLESAQYVEELMGMDMTTPGNPVYD